MPNWNLNNRVGYALGALVAILLGAIGSGLWQNILEPSLQFITQVSITLVTLGKNAFLDSMYQEIAKGFNEKYSIESYYGFTAFVLIGLFLLTLWVRLKLFENETSDSKDISEKRAFLKNTSHLLMFVILTLFVFVQISLISSKYKNNAISHIHQAISICSPYLSEVEIRKLHSQFSSIRSKDDYVKLNNKLKNIAKKDSLYFPKFRIF